MSDSLATVNFETEFFAPHDCLKEGFVSCKVIRADCRVVDDWAGGVTFRLGLVLKITIKEGELLCSFAERVDLKDTIWLGDQVSVTDCEVVQTGCRCVIKRGLVRCSGVAAVKFFIRKPAPPCPPCPTVVVLPIVILPLRC